MVTSERILICERSRVITTAVCAFRNVIRRGHRDPVRVPQRDHIPHARRGLDWKKLSFFSEVESAAGVVRSRLQLVRRKLKVPSAKLHPPEAGYFNVSALVESAVDKRQKRSWPQSMRLWPRVTDRLQEWAQPWHQAANTSREQP